MERVAWLKHFGGPHRKEVTGCSWEVVKISLGPCLLCFGNVYSLCEHHGLLSLLVRGLVICI